MTRSTSFAIAAVLALVGGARQGAADDRPRPEEAGRRRLEGTWEHTFDDAPEHRQVKIINQTHFVWVTYVRADGKPLLVGGGTYTFDGKTYKETYEFGGPRLPAELVGKEQTFTAELDGETWTHTGTLSNDFFVKETWHRVRDGAARPVSDGKPAREPVTTPLPAPDVAVRGGPAPAPVPPTSSPVPTSPGRSEAPAPSPTTESRPHTDDPSSPKTAATPIPAKVLAVNVEDSRYVAISEPHVQVIGSRAFIVGKYVSHNDHRSNPRAGRKIWFRLDKVIDLVEFDSIEAASRSELLR